jgi:hypothetical protein
MEINPKNWTKSEESPLLERPIGRRWDLSNTQKMQGVCCIFGLNEQRIARLIGVIVKLF